LSREQDDVSIGQVLKIREVRLDDLILLWGGGGQHLGTSWLNSNQKPGHSIGNAV